MVKAEFNPGGKATYEDGVWKAEMPAFQKLLNTMTEYFSMGIGAGYDPTPEYTVAKQVTDELQGKIISFTKTKFDPKVVY